MRTVITFKDGRIVDYPGALPNFSVDETRTNDSVLYLFDLHNTVVVDDNMRLSDIVRVEVTL